MKCNKIKIYIVVTLAMHCVCSVYTELRALR